MKLVEKNEANYPEAIQQSIAVFKDATVALRGHLANAAEKEIERCIELAKIRQSCGFYGRPGFTTLVADELGLDGGNAKRMADFGDIAQEKNLCKFTNFLPKGLDPLKEVALMTEAQIEDAIEKNVLHQGATKKSLEAFRTGDQPKKSRKSQKSQPVTVDGFSVELLDMTPEQVMERLKDLADILPPDVVEAASDHNNPNYFACRALAMSHDAMLKALQPLTRKEQKRLLVAFAAVFQHNQKVFDYILKTERPKRIKALEEKLNKKIQAADEKLQKLREGKVAIDEHGVQVMLRADFKRFLGALHPDKHPGQEEKYQVLFNDFKSYEDAYRG